MSGTSPYSLTMPSSHLADEHMERLGYLEGRHMSEAFNLLRENDLIWFFFVNNYLMGREPAAFDLLYWNSDSTRMPARCTVLPAQHVSPQRPEGSGRDQPCRCAHRPDQDRCPAILPVDSRRPHRPVALDVCGHTAGLRTGSVRARCFRAHRRRDQSAVGQQVRLLEQ